MSLPIVGEGGGVVSELGSNLTHFKIFFWDKYAFKVASTSRHSGVSLNKNVRNAVLFIV